MVSAQRPRIGVVRETAPGERRVALVPKVITQLIGKGLDVIVESGAGEAALLPDSAFESAGAVIGNPWDCDVVVKVAEPSTDEIAKLSAGTRLIGFLNPRSQENQIGELKSQGCGSLRHGGYSAYLPRPGDGCIEFSEQRGRLQSRASCR